jgi:hypothetical protein
MGQIGYSSGFAFQSSFSEGNLEVFIPWDPSGFAHYFSDDSETWSGPVIRGMGAGRIKSLAVWESGYRTFEDSDHGNFELLALQSHRLVHWHRDNDDPLEWHIHPEVPNSLRYNALALCRTHHLFHDPEDYPENPETFYALAAKHENGLRIHQRSTKSFEWDIGETVTQMGPQDTELSGGAGEEPIQGHYVGLGWVLGTVGDTRVNFHESNLAQAAFVATRSDGLLICHEDEAQFFHVTTGDPLNSGSPSSSDGMGATRTALRRWQRPQIIWRPQQFGNDLLVGAAGRPCIIQSDRGYNGPSAPFVATFDPPTHGNYEVFVSSKTGGIVHFWRDNSNNDKKWESGGAIGTDRYDEVAAVQDRNMRDGDVTGRIHVFGWKRGCTWVDHFVHSDREDGSSWDGPKRIGQ